MLYDIDIFRFRIIQIHGWINNTSLVHVALGDWLTNSYKNGLWYVIFELSEYGLSRFNCWPAFVWFWHGLVKPEVILDFTTMGHCKLAFVCRRSRTWYGPRAAIVLIVMLLYFIFYVVLYEFLSVIGGGRWLGYFTRYNNFCWYKVGAKFYSIGINSWLLNGLMLCNNTLAILEINHETMLVF